MTRVPRRPRRAARAGHGAAPSPALVAALLLWAAAGASARAAEEPPDPDLSTQNLRQLGPVHIAPFVLVKDVGYDDNIRFESREREGDSTATAGAGLKAVVLAGDRGGLHLSQEVDYVAFGRNTDLNHWNGTSRARGILLLKHLAISLEARRLSERERPNTEIDQRVRRDNNFLTATVRTRRKGRLAMRASVGREGTDYSTNETSFEDTLRRLNRDETTLTLAGEIRILPKTTFTLEEVFERVGFEDAAQGRDNRSRSLLPGFRFDPSASIQGHLRVGVKAFDSPDQSWNNTRTTVGDASLSTRLGRAARLRGTYNRGLVFSILAENLYYLSTEWSAAYEQFFSRRLSGEIAYTRGLNHYPNEVTRGGAEPFQGIRDDRLTTYRAVIRHRINDQLSIVAGSQRLARNSTDDFFDQERNQYTFGSTYNF